VPVETAGDTGALQLDRDIHEPVARMRRDKEAPDAIVHLLFLIGEIERGDRFASKARTGLAQCGEDLVVDHAVARPAEIPEWSRAGSADTTDDNDSDGADESAKTFRHVCALRALPLPAACSAPVCRRARSGRR
jgi:hypothetical protein